MIFSYFSKTQLLGFVSILSLVLGLSTTYVYAIAQSPLDTGFVCSSDNLIGNCNFEIPSIANPFFPDQWTNGSYGTNSVVFTYPEVGVASSSAVRVTMNSYTDGDGKWLMPSVSVTPGSSYVYTDAYQATVPTSLIVETITATSTLYTDYVSVPASSSWATSTVSFVAPADAVSVRVFHIISAVGSLTLDNASLSLATTTPPLPPPVATTTATVEVEIKMVNDNNGINTQGDFNVSVSGQGVTPSFFSGSPTKTVVHLSSLAPYAVTANPGVFYTVLYSPECTGKIAGGDTVTCTITFDDIPPLPAGQSPNLIKNNSFEATSTFSATTPANWSTDGYGTNTRTFSYPVTGVGAGEGEPNGSAGRIDMTSYANGDAKWVFDPVSVVPGHSYIYSDNFLSDVPTSLVVAFFDANGVITYQGFAAVSAPAASTTWKTSSIQFTAPSGAVSAVVYHILSSVGSLTIDNASIVEVPQPLPFNQGFVSLTFDDSFLGQYTHGASILNAKNMKGSFYVVSHLVEGLSIKNGSLDQIDPASSTMPLGWETTGSNNAEFVYPVAGLSGNAAYASSSIDGSNAGWYFSPITVLSDGVYTFTHDYKSTATSTLVVQVTTATTTYQANLLDVSGTDLGTTLLTLPPHDTWTNVRGYAYIPPDAVSITVLHRLSGPGSLTIDNMRWGAVGYMTAEQVLALQATGHEIGSHTQTHAALASVSVDRATDEIVGSRQELLAGGSTPVNTFVYPYGSYNQNVQSMIQNAGYIGARSVIPGFNGRNSDKYALLSESVEAATPLSQIQTWIDTAKANKQWLILTFHDIKQLTPADSFATTPEIVQSVTNYLSATNIPVMTMAQGMDSFANPPVPPAPTTTPTTTPPITPTSTPTTTNNLILNPSFVTSNATNGSLPANWSQDSWGTHTKTFSYPVAGTTDAQAAKVQITAYTDGDSKWASELITAIPGHIYIYSDRYMGTIPTELVVEYLSTSGVYTYGNFTVVPVSSTWATSTVTFVPPTGTASLRVFHVIAGVGSLTIDDALLIDQSADTQPPVIPPAATSTNLILNPSFVTANPSNAALPQNWTKNSWGTHTKTLTYPVAGRTDTKAAKVQITAYTSGDSKWMSDPIAVTPGHTYTYSDYYTATIPTELVVEYKNSANVYTYANYTSVPASATNWGSSTLTFTVPAGMVSARVFHVIAGVGTLTIDDVNLVDQTGTTPPPPPASSIPNSSLEIAAANNPSLPQDWIITSWGTSTASFTYVNEGHTGNKSVKVTLSNYQSGDSSWMYTPQILEKGKDYRFTVWYKTNTIPHVVARYERADGSEYYFGLPDPQPNGTTNWQQYSDVFGVPADAEKVSLIVFVSNNGWVQTDDYAIEPYTYAGFTNGLVSLTFDDGFEQNVSTTLPIFQQYGFKVTQCNATQFLEGQPAQEALLQQYVSQGHEVCSHTVTHPDLTLLSSTTLAYELSHSKQYLESLIGSTVTNFTTPFGAYNKDVNNEIKKYYSSHRTTDEGFNSKDTFDPYRLRVQNMQQNTTLAQFQEWVNKAKADKTWLVLVYHVVNTQGLEQFDTYKSDFDAQMQWLSTAGIPVTRWDQALGVVQSQL